MGQEWNSQKNDALSVYTFASWSDCNDIFVSNDLKHIIRNRDQLYAPYKVLVARPGEDLILQETIEEIPGHIVIPGHIMTPQEAEDYLRKRLEE